jgi:hypothetical protein
VHSETPHRDETSSARPWISPGLVHDDEVLLRTLLDPDHVQNGQLVETGIALKDLRSRGYSLDRRRYTSKWRVFLYQWRRLRRAQRSADSERKAFIGVLHTRRVRGLIAADTQRAFVAIDKPLLLNLAHAEILSAIQRTEGQARQLRKQLVPEIRVVTLSQAFNDGHSFGWLRGHCHALRSCWRHLRTKLSL